MHSRKVFLANRHGIELAAYLDLPDRSGARHFALLLHCFTCSKHIKAYHYISRSLTATGIGVMRLDFTGIGESRGRFADTTFYSNVEDVLDASAWLQQQHSAPVLLIGHSLGGAAALAAAQHLPDCRAVTVIGTPDETHHLYRLLSSERTRTADPQRREITLGGKTFEISAALLDSLRHHQQRAHIEHLGRPLLVLHAPDDDTVSLASGLNIFRAASQPKAFIALDGADHLLSNETDARYAGRLIATWMQQQLDGSGDDLPTAPYRAGQTTVRLGQEHYHATVNANGHLLHADEPAAEGGSDAGPSPYDLLCASLGACTAMTLRMYADHKGWPLEEVIVSLSHEKIHAQDCQDCEQRDGKLDRLLREIEIRGALDTSQQQRLLEIAERCPVHRSLHGRIVVTTRLV